jgi:hypothetical protein
VSRAVRCIQSVRIAARDCNARRRLKDTWRSGSYQSSIISKSILADGLAICSVFFDPRSPWLWRGKQKHERKKKVNGAGFAEALQHARGAEESVYREGCRFCTVSGKIQDILSIFQSFGRPASRNRKRIRPWDPIPSVCISPSAANVAGKT